MLLGISLDAQRRRRGWRVPLKKTKKQKNDDSRDHGKWTEEEEGKENKECLKTIWKSVFWLIGVGSEVGDVSSYWLFSCLYIWFVDVQWW